MLSDQVYCLFECFAELSSLLIHSCQSTCQMIRYQLITEEKVCLCYRLYRCEKVSSWYVMHFPRKTLCQHLGVQFAERVGMGNVKFPWKGSSQFPQSLGKSSIVNARCSLRKQQFPWSLDMGTWMDLPREIMLAKFHTEYSSEE